MTLLVPKTFVVGGGPVATALAGAFRQAGVPVLGLWARRGEQASAAGAVAGVAGFSEMPRDVVHSATVVVLAVRDDAIADVAGALADGGFLTRGHSVIHCSGSLSAEQALASIADRVGGIAVMHPLRAIVDGRAAMSQLRGTLFGVEGDDVGRRHARALIRAIGGRELELEGGQNAAYHAAAAVVSNYLVGLVDVAAELMAAAGVPGDAALEALIGLAAGTLDNLRDCGLPSALTGPIRRGDRNTVARHLHALAGAHPDVSELYRLLGRRVLGLARQLGDASEADLDAIEGLLGSSKVG